MNSPDPNRLIRTTTYQQSWTAPLTKELGQILAFVVHESWSRQDAIDRLRNTADWLERFEDTLPARDDLLRESPGGF